MQVDILDQSESLRRPLIQSVMLHVAVGALLVLSTISFNRSHETWGSANTRGGAVAVNPVNIPLPHVNARKNPVANDTASQVPAPPKTEPKKQVKAPEPDAIPIKRRNTEKQPRQTSSRHYQPETLPPNQLYSSTGAAAENPMFQKPGGGAIGVGPNSVFGTRFGAYADLVIQRVSEKWQTSGLAGLHAVPDVVVTFDIQRDGSVKNAQIAQRSGNSTLDYSALRAVMDAAPFPPLPPGFDRNVAGVELKFQLTR